MSGTLDTWLDGVPVLRLGDPGSDFATWMHGAPVIQVEGASAIVVLTNEVVFYGEIVRASIRGRRVSARCQSGGSIFERQVPRYRLQPGCNHTLFDVGCGLAKSDWKFTATVSGPGTVGYPFEFALSGLARVSGPTPTFAEHWFAGGWAEFGTGPEWCRRAILCSSAVAGGAVTITLSKDPAPFPEAGDPVTLYPGCDGRWESCGPYHATDNPAGKFDNRLNFGGHPFMPIANPSLVKVSTAVAGGKKS